MPELNKEKLPRHVGIIMDGNGRWAQQRGLSRSEGHEAGAKAFRRVSDYATDIGIELLTFYAFSTENWNRPQAEVDALMSIFRDYLDEAEEREEENERRGIRARYIGSFERMPADIRDRAREAERRSADKRKTTVNIAVNYGGRDEILQAVQALARQCAQGERKPEELTEADVESHLYTAGQPDPDLIIRPSGELRLSNFLLWQSAYSELWFSEVLWPDFTVEHFQQALQDYAKRNRRFGRS